MSLREDRILAEIREIISEAQGIDSSQIHLDTQLFDDLGIAGDDADEIFQELDKRFTIDWNNIHLGIHFGNEGLGYPFPWMLKNDCSQFEQQPCSVRDLVKAAHTRKWKGTPRIPRSLSVRATIYAISTIQFLFLTILSAIAIIVLVFEIFT